MKFLNQTSNGNEFIQKVEKGKPGGVACLDAEGKLAAYQVKTYSFSQTNSSSIWLVNHNQKRYPTVIVVDSSGQQIIGDVKYLDSNNLRIEFTYPFSGIVYLN